MVSIKQIKLSEQDKKFVESREFTREEIKTASGLFDAVKSIP